MMTIKPFPQRRNANRHTQRGMAALETSIASDGWIGAVTVAADGETFDGSARVEKTAENGMLDDAIVIDSDGTKPIVVRRTDIPSATDPRAVRLGIAANRVAELNLSWEPDILSSIADSGIDLASLFTADEWADVAMPSQGEPEADEPIVIDETKPTRCQAGDVWRIGRHLVSCSDSTDRANVERLLAGRAVGMVVADPPYGINLAQYSMGNAITSSFVANDEDTSTARRAAEIILPMGGVQVWWGANYYADALPVSMGWIVWDKDHHGMTFADGELAWTNQQTPLRCFRHAWSGADRDSEKGEDRTHPTQKPIALFTWLYSRFAADLIFDPFLGSGPSLKAAEPSGRTVIGCELSPHYIDHIIEWGDAEGLAVTLMDG